MSHTPINMDNTPNSRSTRGVCLLNRCPTVACRHSFSCTSIYLISELPSWSRYKVQWASLSATQKANCSLFRSFFLVLKFLFIKAFHIINTELQTYLVLSGVSGVTCSRHT